MRRLSCLTLTGALLLTISLPALSACGSSAPAPETSSAAAASVNFTPDDLVGTTWRSASTSKENSNFCLEFPTKTRCYLTWVVGSEVTSAQRFGYLLNGQDIDMDDTIEGSISSDLGKIKLDFPDGSSCVFVPDNREQTTLEQYEELVDEVDAVFNSNGRRSKAVASHVPTEEEEEKKGNLDDEILGSVCVRVRLPGEWAAKGVKWNVDEKQQRITLLYSNAGKDVELADVAWDRNADLDREVKEEIWELGDVMFEGQVRPAVLHIPYVDKNGNTIALKADSSKADLACTHFVNLSSTKLMGWIELVADDDDVNGLSLRRDNFCGVWSYSSKKLSEALTVSNQARQQGFAAEVFYAPEWTGLGDENVYLVCLGCALSDEEAESVLSNAHFAGYSDAYVEWSGDRK